MAASGFALSQLEKFGWKAGEGLGVNEQGIKSPLRASFKSDKAGLGSIGKFDGEKDNWWDHLYSRSIDNFGEKPQKKKRKLESAAPTKCPSVADETPFTSSCLLDNPYDSHFRLSSFLLDEPEGAADSGVVVEEDRETTIAKNDVGSGMAFTGRHGSVAGRFNVGAGKLQRAAKMESVMMIRFRKRSTPRHDSVCSDEQLESIAPDKIFENDEEEVRDSSAVADCSSTSLVDQSSPSSASICGSDSSSMPRKKGDTKRRRKTRGKASTKNAKR